MRRVPTRWEVVAPESCPGSWGALTVRVHPHGRGRDIGRDVEVGQPEILRGRDGAMGRLVAGCATAGWGGGVRGWGWSPGCTSICLSWKTLLMLALKAEPENMEVMG